MDKPDKTRVLICEDQGLFRDMLRLTLSAQPRIDVVGAVGDGVSAVRLARELKPDVVLMDIELGSEPDGIAAGRQIRQTAPKTGIVILSMHKDKEYIFAIPMAQASGWSYLLKQSVSDVGALVRAIEGSASGLMVLDPAIVDGLKPVVGSRLSRLTQRQREVLELIAQGYNNSTIAEKLVLNEKSVENYINALYQELDIHRGEPVHPRVKAVLLYLEESQRA
ncbi:MAG: response regulator transcription factor [Chloroflexota bacterium]|nr:response regulator transcription factor [Chloroflexota bacterium]